MNPKKIFQFIAPISFDEVLFCLGTPTFIAGIISYIKIFTMPHNEFFNFFIYLSFISTLIMIILIMCYIIGNSKNPRRRINRYTRIKEKMRKNMDERKILIESDERFYKNKPFIHNLRESLFVGTTGYFAFSCDVTKGQLVIIPHHKIKEITYKRNNIVSKEIELIIKTKDRQYPTMKFYCIHRNIIDCLVKDLIFLKRKFISQRLSQNTSNFQNAPYNAII